MEDKNAKNHYLHPDFEEIDINIQKKPSPLALLAQTCKNIGSVKEQTNVHCYDKSGSPHSKRCHSDSSSDLSSTVDRTHLSPAKKMKIENIASKKSSKSSATEMKAADTSTDGLLLANLLEFINKPNEVQLTGTKKLEWLNTLLADQCHSFNQLKDSSKIIESSRRGSQFNLSRGYHLETNEELRPDSCNSNKHHRQIDQNIYRSVSNLTGAEATTSAIKYCMYCGQFIPVLPMLLAHIRIEHGNTNFPNPVLDKQCPLVTNNMYDILSNFGTYPMKPNEPLSLLTDYLGSSFRGKSNLIY